jgi:hypothetical protein
MSAREPAPRPSIRHKWHRDVLRLAACDMPDGNERNIRICIYCMLEKRTVIPPHGYPWRAWREDDGDEFVSPRTPPCKPPGLDKAAA